ncbi:MAG: ExbD/TolR family protein [Myxococcota bacterium]
MRLGSISGEDLDRDEEPNVAPLIDIVFILLIFFVVTTTFAKDLGLEVERPEAQSAREQPSAIVRVAIDRNDALTVDGRATSPWRLRAEVEDRLSSYAEKSVLVVADVAVPAETLVQAMDACRLAGATQVALAVEESR